MPGGLCRSMCDCLDRAPRKTLLPGGAPIGPPSASTSPRRVGSCWRRALELDAARKAARRPQGPYLSTRRFHTDLPILVSARVAGMVSAEFRLSVLAGELSIGGHVGFVGPADCMHESMNLRRISYVLELAPEKDRSSLAALKLGSVGGPFVLCDGGLHRHPIVQDVFEGLVRGGSSQSPVSK